MTMSTEPAGDDKDSMAPLQQQLEQSRANLVNSRPESRKQLHSLLEQSLSATLQTVKDYQLLPNTVTGAILQEIAKQWEKDMLPILDNYIYKSSPNQQDIVHNAQQWYKAFSHNDECCKSVQAIVNEKLVVQLKAELESAKKHHHHQQQQQQQQMEEAANGNGAENGGLENDHESGRAIQPDNNDRTEDDDGTITIQELVQEFEQARSEYDRCERTMGEIRELVLSYLSSFVWKQQLIEAKNMSTTELLKDLFGDYPRYLLDAASLVALLDALKIWATELSVNLNIPLIVDENECNLVSLPVHIAAFLEKKEKEAKPRSRRDVDRLYVEAVDGVTKLVQTALDSFQNMVISRHAQTIHQPETSRPTNVEPDGSSDDDSIDDNNGGTAHGDNHTKDTSSVKKGVASGNRAYSTSGIDETMSSSLRQLRQDDSNDDDSLLIDNLERSQPTNFTKPSSTTAASAASENDAEGGNHTNGGHTKGTDNSVRGDAAVIGNMDEIEVNADREEFGRRLHFEWNSLLDETNVPLVIEALPSEMSKELYKVVFDEWHGEAFPIWNEYIPFPANEQDHAHNEELVKRMVPLNQKWCQHFESLAKDRLDQYMKDLKDATKIAGDERDHWKKEAYKSKEEAEKWEKEARHWNLMAEQCNVQWKRASGHIKTQANMWKGNYRSALDSNETLYNENKQLKLEKEGLTHVIEQNKEESIQLKADYGRLEAQLKAQRMPTPEFKLAKFFQDSDHGGTDEDYEELIHDFETNREFYDLTYTGNGAENGGHGNRGGAGNNSRATGGPSNGNSSDGSEGNVGDLGGGILDDGETANISNAEGGEATIASTYTIKQSKDLPGVFFQVVNDNRLPSIQWIKLKGPKPYVEVGDDDPEGFWAVRVTDHIAFNIELERYWEKETNKTYRAISSMLTYFKFGSLDKKTRTWRHARFHPESKKADFEAIVDASKLFTTKK
jgi:hypothetical protein